MSFHHRRVGQFTAFFCPLFFSQRKVSSLTETEVTWKALSQTSLFSSSNPCFELRVLKWEKNPRPQRGSRLDIICTTTTRFKTSAYLVSPLNSCETIFANWSLIYVRPKLDSMAAYCFSLLLRHSPKNVFISLVHGFDMMSMERRREEAILRISKRGCLLPYAFKILRQFMPKSDSGRFRAYNEKIGPNITPNDQKMFWEWNDVYADELVWLLGFTPKYDSPKKHDWPESYPCIQLSFNMVKRCSLNIDRKSVV